MGQYVTQWGYKSGLAEFSQGAVVHMTDELAAAVMNDSPGVLLPATAEDLDRESRGLPVVLQAPAPAEGGQEPGEEEHQEEDDLEASEPDEESEEAGTAEEDEDPAEGGQEPGEGTRQVTAARNRRQRRGSNR